MELSRPRLLSRPRSFPPAWISRTSGLSPDERTAGRSWLHLIPPFPTHCTLVLCRPRFGSQAPSALLSAHFTKLWPTISTTFSEIFEYIDNKLTNMWCSRQQLTSYHDPSYSSIRNEAEMYERLFSCLVQAWCQYVWPPPPSRGQKALLRIYKNYLLHM